MGFNSGLKGLIKRFQSASYQKKKKKKKKKKAMFWVEFMKFIVPFKAHTWVDVRFRG